MSSLRVDQNTADPFLEQCVPLSGKATEVKFPRSYDTQPGNYVYGLMLQLPREELGERWL